jgi:ribosomal protein S18 acetylase RimI-like enzyme
MQRVTVTVYVEQLRPAQAAAAGNLLAASHHDYPAFRYLFPDPAVRGRVLRPFMAATARDAARMGHSVLARDDKGLLGVALWMPPSTFPLSAIRKARMTPALLRAAIAAGRAFAPFARSGAALEAAHPPGPAWYLQALGVHPRAQRRGVGKRLMARALELADEARLPCHLFTSDPANEDYYRRFGFTVTQPAIRVFGNGPYYLGMTRPPRRP